jgi:hypothetical protein
MFDIVSVIPGKKKTTPNGWVSFNSVCCHHLGHKQDKRSRGGLKLGQNGEWTAHCFNCNYSCGFKPGDVLTLKARNYLKWLNVDDETINRINFESLKSRDIFQAQKKQEQKRIVFNEIDLPDNIEILESGAGTDYLEHRCALSDNYLYLTLPPQHRASRPNIMIPFTDNGHVVGYAYRYLDDKTPKYIQSKQTGYVFNVDNQQKNWQFCILTEGIFDAISIDGCALLHDDISDEQASVISKLNRKIIMVPDRDKAGLKIIDRALELGYEVSLPEWEPDIKDVNDAVIRYGKVSTLLSIIQSSTKNKIKIEMQIRNLKNARKL